MPQTLCHAPDGLRFLPIKMYVPHEKGMRLIDELSFVSTSCVFTRTLMMEGSNFYNLIRTQDVANVENIISSDEIKHDIHALCSNAAMPSYFLVELAAQSVGAWASYFDIIAGKNKVDFGMLLGGRNVKFYCDEVKADSLIEVRANMIFKDNRLGSFEFEIFTRELSSEDKTTLEAKAQEFLHNFESSLLPKSFKPLDYSDALTLCLQRVSLGLGQSSPYTLAASGRINIYEANEEQIEEIFRTTA